MNWFENPKTRNLQQQNLANWPRTFRVELPRWRFISDAINVQMEGNFTFKACQIKTGKLHQIRINLEMLKSDFKNCFLFSTNFKQRFQF